MDTGTDHRVNLEGYSLTNMLYSDRKKVSAANPARVPPLIQFVRLSRLARSFFTA